MKALVCAACGDIQALQTEWRSCTCGNVSARWTDSHAGLAEFRAVERHSAFMLGLNNTMLLAAFDGAVDVFEKFRAVHDLATETPNHIFDKSRAACWAVITRPGRTSDVTWAEGES